jgi:hypothetical protein
VITLPLGASPIQAFTGLGSQLSVAVTLLVSATGTSLLHITVIGAGHVTIGFVVSLTVIT